MDMRDAACVRSPRESPMCESDSSPKRSKRGQSCATCSPCVTEFVATKPIGAALSNIFGRFQKPARDVIKSSTRSSEAFNAPHPDPLIRPRYFAPTKGGLPKTYEHSAAGSTLSQSVSSASPGGCAARQQAESGRRPVRTPAKSHIHDVVHHPQRHFGDAAPETPQSRCRRTGSHPPCESVVTSSARCPFGLNSFRPRFRARAARDRR